MSRARLVPKACGGVACAAMLVVAAVADGRQVPQGRLDGPSSGPRIDGGRQATPALPGPALAADGTAAEFTPFETLTWERRMVTVPTDPPAETGEAWDTAEEDLGKRQVAVRARTRVVHPAANVRHATQDRPSFFPDRTVVEENILAVLDQPVEPWEFDESPLRDVAMVIEDRCRIPVRIDSRSLEEAGMDSDTPLSGSISGDSLRSALERLLAAVDLVLLVKDDVLLVTTRDRAAQDLVVGLYPAPTGVHDAELVDLIQTTIAPETWATIGGAGGIAMLPWANELVVSQTREVHEQVTAFLACLDSDLDEVPRVTGGAALRAYPIRDPKVRSELQANLVKVCNSALGERADPQARTYQLGGAVVVQSASRALHVYAAEVIRSVNGVEMVTQEVLESGPGAAWGIAPVEVGVALPGSPPGPFRAYVYENNAEAKLVSPLQVLGRSDVRRAVSGFGGDHAQAGRVLKESVTSSEVAVRSRTAVMHPQPRMRHALHGSGPRFPGRLPANSRIFEALEQPVGEWRFDESPLRDVKRSIEERSRLPVEIDARALEEAGMDVDTLVSGSAAGVSLRAAIEQLLATIDLVYMVEDGVVLITTKEQADGHLEVGLYPVPVGTHHAELIDLIQTTIVPDTWCDVGGPGAIRFLAMANELVISQTRGGHEAIAAFLRRLEAVPAGDGPPPADAPSGPHVLLHAIREPATRTDLERSLVPICNAALGRLVDPDAKAYSLGGNLVVQSASRAFQRAAAELIRSIEGVEVTTHEVFDGSPPTNSIEGSPARVTVGF